MNNVKLDVRVYPIDEPKGSTVAFANVGINDAVAITGIRVVHADKGNFVAMPQNQDKDGNYHNYATVTNDAVKKAMTKAILAEYKNPTRAEDGQIVGRTVAAKTEQELSGAVGVKVYPLKDPQGATKAFAKISIGDLVEISSARVVTNNDKGNFVAMPQSRDKEGKYHDIAFPINADLRGKMSKCVLAEFDKANERSAVRSFSDRLAAGAQKSAEYRKNAPEQAAAAKKLPGLGD